MKRRVPFAFALLVAVASAAVVKNQGYLPFADAPIHYRSQKLDDPVARLEQRLERGETKLRWDQTFGYLPAVLESLRIPVSSQTLVFSKTSFQFNHISPQKPRALYFNDDVYVGRVQDAKFLEFVSFDPVQGAIFYILDDNPAGEPRFERSEVDCVQCHVAPATRGIPGVMMRSVFTRPSGYPAAGLPAFVNGQDTPLADRWGGWFVTARNAPSAHMGNTLTPSQGVKSTLPIGQIVDSKHYLTNSSDIVALMVLAHQTQMHNLITEASYRARIAEYENHDWSDAQQPAEELVRYLLFANEIPLTSPIAGDSSFARDFAARGPRDPAGRSLRDFDLQKRIFKYPCSYLIYSEDFGALPPKVKQYIYQRLYDILTGRDQSPLFASLTSEDRRAIFEILVATKPDLPQEWKQSARRKPGNSTQQKGNS
ncbi:MAG TPA: hypothetical protein VKX25_03215 [Bryobacteraceae bacterium]|nr:hypothetical protein [Bryobacteraceae bacterium]